ncbi:MAG TPA: hydroxymethylbilane synthase [Rickettsiales bacterium]|nr:hydroxymethylbilane synthase [Rickettsiales bacterium]
MTQSNIRIATRRSPLAIVQAEIVRQHLLAAFPNITAELVPMSTTGDANTNLSLSEIGGKGLFTKELEEGLIDGSLDIAVHSLKDMETVLPDGLIIAAMIEREDPRDALIAPQAKTLAALPAGAKVGTSSLRRAAQIKIIRPDVTIVPFRGNVATRLAKLEAGGVDATMLAMAGLKRLNVENRATEVFAPNVFIPAVGQGIIAIECRQDNTVMLDMLQAVNHYPTYIAGITERSMLATLDGSCRTPIAGYARFMDDVVRIDAMVADTAGVKYVAASRSGAAKDAVSIGQEIAHELLANGGRECLAHS